MDPIIHWEKSISLLRNTQLSTEESEATSWHPFNKNDSYTQTHHTSGDHGCWSGCRTMKVNPGKTHTLSSKHVTIDNLDLVGRVFGQSYYGQSWSSSRGDILTKSPFLWNQFSQTDFSGGFLGYLSSAEGFLTDLFPTLEFFSADEFLVGGFLIGEFAKEEFSACSSPAKGFSAEELPANIGTEPPKMSYFSA